jgi:hypothetical protein
VQAGWNCSRIDKNRKVYGQHGALTAHSIRLKSRNRFASSTSAVAFVRSNTACFDGCAAECGACGPDGLRTECRRDGGDGANDDLHGSYQGRVIKSISLRDAGFS